MRRLHPRLHWLGVVLVLFLVASAAAKYDLTVETDAPFVVRGAPIQFHAELRDNGVLVDDQYKFTWKDNAIRGHSGTFETKSPVSNWTISYPADLYNPGPYIVEVVVEKWVFVFYNIITSKRIQFEVTSMLNGNLELSQNGTVRSDAYVSSATEVTEMIEIRPADLAFVQNASYIRTYWFSDCVYQGMSTNFSVTNPFTEENREYDVQSLVVASFEPLPEPTTTTTTTTTTSTTTTTTSTTTTTTPATTSTSTTTTTPATTSTTVPTTTQKPTTSTSPPKPNTETSSTEAPKLKVKREVTSGTNPAANTNTEANSNRTEPAQFPANMSPDIRKLINDKLLWAKYNNNQPFTCINQSSIVNDTKKVYGFFQRKIIVQNPINNLTITGQNWLQPGDVTSLRVKCHGTPPYEYCIKIKDADYNKTGNETCRRWIPLDTCDFPFSHFSSITYKVLVIVRNRVAQQNREVAINIYKVEKQSQLSVIVVPVAFCLIAVILVVFGVAYYMQNRNKFAVEVADFNFVETASVDMEYKTFQKRLFDDIRDIVFRRTAHTDDNASESSLKYGTMT